MMGKPFWRRYKWASCILQKEIGMLRTSNVLAGLEPRECSLELCCFHTLSGNCGTYSAIVARYDLHAIFAVCGWTGGRHHLFGVLAFLSIKEGCRVVDGAMY